MVTMVDIETEASELEDEIARLDGVIEQLADDVPENGRPALCETRDALADKLHDSSAKHYLRLADNVSSCTVQHTRVVPCI